jgi:hypothetical protein
MPPAIAAERLLSQGAARRNQSYLRSIGKLPRATSLEARVWHRSGRSAPDGSAYANLARSAEVSPSRGSSAVHCSRSRFCSIFRYDWASLRYVRP